MLCLIFENGICKETVPAILRYISLRFLIFEQALFTIQKGIRKKTVPDFLELISILFLIFGKGISKKL